MVSPSYLPNSIAILTLQLVLLFLTCCLSQDPSSTTPPSPLTMANCGARLLPLAACAPFVQGTAQSPSPPCCDNLKLLYSQQASCLCLLLSDSTVSAFPINRTLALQLPTLCTLEVSTSNCSGSPVSSSPPSSPVSLGSNNNSTAAASPVVQVAPRQSILGFGFGQSGSMMLKQAGEVAALVAAVTSYLLK